MDSGQIINRVASSSLITFNLADFYTPGERVFLDIRPWLFMELVLKEKEFRETIKNHDWSQYAGKCVSIGCTSDAIVPTWAYMLIATALQPHTPHFIFGTPEQLETELFLRALHAHDFSSYAGEKIVIKGCSEIAVPVAVYVELTRRLMPLAQKISYGEPCSTVPLFKKS